MVEIAKETLIENVFQNFDSRMRDQITSVTVTGNTSVSVQNYASAFSDYTFNKKSDFPLLIVESPRFSTEFFTMGITKANGTIDIEIYTTSAESADKFLSKIINAIETHRGALRDQGIRMVELESTDNDMVERGQMKIHMRRARFQFEYHFSRSRAY